MDFTIKKIDKNSIAEECDINIGDKLLKINGEILEDVIDYEYYLGKEEMLLEIIDNKEEKYEVEIQKESFEDLGIIFEDTSFGKKKACKNKCIFCFVDQLPKNMRKGLYFKDDDWRLSFLMGNYITLTNLSTQEIFRIIQQEISPLYISLHATDKAINNKMIGIDNNAFEIMKTFASHNIIMNVQIVLCEDINDKDILLKTIEDLYALNKNVKSIAVVPVGITQHREGLFELKEISCKSARHTVNIVEKLQERFLKEIKTRFVFCSDEMYIKAQLTLPKYECYENFDQIENGVGLMAKFEEEIKDGLYEYKNSPYKSVGLITSQDAYRYMCNIAKNVSEALNVNINVYNIENELFGKSVTVTGLLSGKDIIKKLKGNIENDVLLICDVCFMEKEDIMLDNMTLDELSKALNVKIKRVELDGYEFIRNLAEDN